MQGGISKGNRSLRS